jgi:thiol-disulfide isomerase/thioredoxin
VNPPNFFKIYRMKALQFILLLLLSPSVMAVELSNPSLEGSDGVTYHLKDFIGKGRWTVMVVWGAKCPACLEEMPDVQGLYDRRDKTGIDILGLAIDYPSFDFPDIQEVQLYEEDNFITFPNLLIDYQVFTDLGLGRLKGTPTIVILNPEGKAIDMRSGIIPMTVVEGVINKRRNKK